MARLPPGNAVGCTFETGAAPPAQSALLVADPERARWSELAERSGSIYATPEWLGTWWSHFGDGRRLVVERMHDDAGRLVGILPLYEWRSEPFRVLRFVGHGPSDVLGPICAPKELPHAAAALREAVRRERADAFVGEEMAHGVEWSGVLGGRILRRRPSPVLRIEGRTWDDFLASHRRSTRQKIRACERKVRRARLSYRLTGEGELDRDLDALFSLHAERFPRRTSDFAWDTRLRAFHRAFAEIALERGWLRLWLLERDGVPVAAHYGFSYGGSHYGYSGGWDPRHARLTPGKALLLHALRQAFEEEVADYRFLRGGEAYKYWYANDDVPVDTIAVTRGVLPRVALDAYYGLWRVRQGVREARRSHRLRLRGPA